MQRIKKMLSNLLGLFPVLRKWLRIGYLHIEYLSWKSHNSPVPPPHTVKQYVLWKYSHKYDIEILVETGTYYGQMIEGMKDFFSEIYSVELNKDFHDLAIKKFEREKHITLLWGDSGLELAKVVAKLTKPALFWLDAHYSAGETARGKTDTPIYEELRTIFAQQNISHFIIIDDARCFGSDPAYPSVDELRDYVDTLHPGLMFHVAGDSVRVIPKI